MVRIPKNLRDELDSTGLTWALINGGRHYKIKLAGKLVGIYPRSPTRDVDRAAKNTIAQIRRAVREIHP